MEAGTVVGITISLGPRKVSVTVPPDDQEEDHIDRSARGRPQLPAPAGGKRTLVLRGLVMGIFGLVLLTAFEPGSGQFRLYSAVVIIADWLFVTIDARMRADRGRPLLVQGRISGLLGLSVLLVWLIRDVLLVRYPSLAPGLDDLLKDLAIAPRLVGSWAICIGIIRIIAAMQLGWDTKNLLLMGTAGVSLVVMGILLWLLDFEWWRLLGLLALVSAITLIAVALRVHDGAEWDGTVSQRRV